MTLIAVASFSGSPGVTTAALSIAACWPAEADPVLVEADPSGGDLQAWFGLPDAPGMVSLAAAARRGSSPDLLAGHAAHLPGGLQALPGPVGASQAHAAASQLAAVGYEPVTAAASAGRVIVADCGRLTPGTPVTRLLDAANLLLVVTTGDAAALAHVHAPLGTLADLAGQTELLLSGRPGPYPAAEISNTLSVDVAGRLPWDPAGAALLRGVPVRRGWRTRWRPVSRLPLLAAAAETAWRISRALNPPDVLSEPGTRQPGTDGSPPGEPVPIRTMEASASRRGTPR
jgi:cellulose biosynthesis protein BcsQ